MGLTSGEVRSRIHPSCSHRVEDPDASADPGLGTHELGHRSNRGPADDAAHGGASRNDFTRWRDPCGAFFHRLAGNGSLDGAQHPASGRQPAAPAFRRSLRSTPETARCLARLPSSDARRHGSILGGTGQPAAERLTFPLAPSNLASAPAKHPSRPASGRWLRSCVGAWAWAPAPAGATDVACARPRSGPAPSEAVPRLLLLHCCRT